MNAWLCTIEQGIHTYDIYRDGISKEKVGTREFADAVIQNLGNKPTVLKEVKFAADKQFNLPKYERKAPRKKELVGVDVFVNWRGTNPDELGKIVEKLNNSHVQLVMITNRGIKVWPDGFSETFCTDHWRCRFMKKDQATLTHANIVSILQQAIAENIDTIKTENLYEFDGKPAFSLGQGQN
jgi:isocitrate dehydrogenase